MKIAILSPWTVKQNSVGGTERFVIDLAESFSKKGHAVDVYMLSGNTYEMNGVAYKSVDIFKNNKEVDEYFLKSEFDNFNSVTAFKNLALKIEEKVNFSDYDLVQLNSQLFIETAKNNRRIFTIHTNPFEYKLDWGDKSFGIMLMLMSDNYRNTNTNFVTPSRHYANVYEELSDIHIDFIPHAIDVNRLYCSKTKAQIYEEMGISNNKKIILLPSRLEPIQKQPMLFMKAFAAQSDEIKSKYKIICTGADKQYEQFKDKILDFCKENKIDISIKRFEEMSEGYKACDVVILPSKSESFGYAALESLSLGIVTIINNIPTYMEIVKDSKNAYVFDNTGESLKGVLIKVLNGDLSRKQQEKAWINKYSTELFASKYLKLNRKER